MVNLEVQSSSPQSAKPHRSVTSKVGWQGALNHFQIELTPETAPLPVEFESIPAAQSVFEHAGARNIAVDRYGNQFGVFGFPDLNKPTSKVIIIRPVLHTQNSLRFIDFQQSGPHPCSSQWILMSTTLDVEQACMSITGRTNKGDRIIAVEPRVVYIQRNNDIVRWDGRRESDMGTIRQAIASLVLQWSQR